MFLSSFGLPDGVLGNWLSTPTETLGAWGCHHEIPGCVPWCCSKSVLVAISPTFPQGWQFLLIFCCGPGMGMWTLPALSPIMFYTIYVIMFYTNQLHILRGKVWLLWCAPLKEEDESQLLFRKFSMSEVTGVTLKFPVFFPYHWNSP